MLRRNPQAEGRDQVGPPAGAVRPVTPLRFPTDQSAASEQPRPRGPGGVVAVRSAAALALMGAVALGLKLATLHGNVSAVWPATGVGIWMLIMFGARLWPVIAAGVFVVELGVAQVSATTSAWLALASTLEALAGAWLWREVRKRCPEDYCDAAACFTVALAAPVVSASVGAMAVSAAGVVEVSTGSLWFTWWTGDAIGALVLLPVLLSVGGLGRMVRSATGRDAGKAALVLAAAAGVSGLSFAVEGGAGFLFSIFPVLLLAMVWFGAPGVRLVALLVAFAGIAGEFAGRGPFGGGDLHSNLLSLQVFLASVATAALVLPLFRTRGNRLPVVVVLLVGWLLSGWIFATLQRDGRRNQEKILDDRVAAAESAIRTRITSYVDALRGGVSFLTATRTVERGGWQAYVASLELAKRYPGINGIGVIYPVEAEALPAWLTRIRADGAPDFGVKPFPATTGPAEDVKYVITYVEPVAKNQASPGRDVATEPSRRRAADLARDTGEPRMNRRIPGSRDAERRSGFLLYVPLYRAGAAVGTVAERRAAHVGWVYAQFFVDNFLDGVLGPMGQTLQLYFFEEGQLGREQLLYASGPTGPATRPTRTLTGPLPRFDRVTAMEMAGQRFSLGWLRGASYTSGEPLPIAWAAVSFTLATLLLAGLVHSLQTSREHARTMVEERTRELLATQGRLRGVLDGTAFGVIATTPAGVIEVFNVGAERMLGYTAEEMVGRQTPALLHVAAEVAARAAELSAELGRAIEPGFEVIVARARLNQSDEHEWTYVRKDGSRLPVLLSVTALRDRRGAISGFLGIAQDITARKQAEAAREEDLARLGKLGAQVPGMIYQFRLRADGSSCFPYASEGIREIYRVTPEEVREDATKVFGVLHPDDLAAVAESIHASARTLQPWSREYRVRYADGTVRWLLGNSVPEREADGSVLWHGFITDSTERRRVAQELAEQEARMRLVLDEMPVGVRWVRRIDGGLETVLNPAHEEITGVSRRDSEVPNAYLARTHPDDIVVQEAGLARVRAGERAYFSLEKRYLQPGGGVKWVVTTWRRRILPGNGNFEELSTVMDINAQKEAELALRKTVREVGDLKAALDAHALVVVTDAQGRITHANARFCAVSKFSAAELIGQTPRLVNSQEHPPEFFAEMWGTISRGEIWRGELRNRAKDGTDYWVSSAVMPSCDETGRPVGYVAIQIDITERKRLEGSLAMARDQALEASRLKSEFLATISHEIRTPMNAVIGMAGLLADSRLEPDQSEMVATIIGGAENLLTIINDILDFSRIEAGRMRLDSTVFDFRRIVDETVALLAGRAHEKGVELTCEFEAMAGTMVLGDGGRVRQVLTNLIGNAIKFTDVGQVDVRVRPGLAAAGRRRLRVTVRDTGVGIPHEAQGRLFQPFTQADGSSTRRFGGTGLGLAICRQLVELMGGEIGYESEPGKGSLFWFELEFTRQTSAGSAPAVAIPPGRRALVVDDSETNRRILVGQMTPWGIDVEAVADGPAALARLRDPAAGRWDVVVMDGQMPAMSGLALAVAIRADPALAGLPLVMLSSGGTPGDGGAVAAVGFADILTKPVTAQQLGRCLSRVLAAGPVVRAEPRAAVPPIAANRGGLRLLLVEDNPANQRVAAMMLAKLGHAVTIAADGELALTQLAAGGFEAVLMDCQMPVLDGYATTRRIRGGTVPGINARVPIIALTAYARPEDRARCLDAGMDDYVTKPIRAAELRAALERCGLGSGGTDAAEGKSGPAAAAADDSVFDEEALESARLLPGTEGPSLLPELVRLYLSDEAERLERLAQLLADRRAEPLGDEVHGFGGNAASFGGLGVRRVALELERMARAGRWAEATREFGRLRDACQRLRAEVTRRRLDGA